MANDLETPSFGNFSLDDGMEMAGSQGLINDFLSPADSVVADPKKIEKIEKKTAPIKKEVKKQVEEEEEEEEEEDKITPIIDPLGEIKEEEEGEEEEDKKPVKKEQQIQEEEESDDEEGGATNTFQTLAKELFNLNVFTKDEDEEEEEITTPEQFLDRFNYEKKKGAIETVNTFIGQFGEDYQKAFEAIYVKGVNPKEYFSSYNKLEKVAELDLSVESNQEAVVRQGLLDQGMEQEDVDAKLEKIKNYGDLEEESQRFHKVLLKKESAKLAQLERDSELKLQQEQAFKQQYIQNVNNVLQEKIKAKEFDGIPINTKLAQELQNFLLVDKYKTPTGEKLTEFDRVILDLKKPENHTLKVKVALLLKTLEKDPTLSTIQKKAITKETNSLFGELARQTTKSSVKKSVTGPKKGLFEDSL